jgi:hypothetical protein
LYNKKSKLLGGIVKNFLLLIVFVVVGYFIYQNIKPTKVDKIKEFINKPDKVINKDIASKKLLKRKFVEFNSQSKKYYEKSKDMLVFAKESRRQLALIRKLRPLSSAGTLGLSGIRNLIKQCEAKSKKIKKAGDGFKILASMVKNVSKTCKPSKEEKRKYDEILGKLTVFQEEEKGIDKLGEDIHSKIFKSFNLLVSKVSRRNASAVNKNKFSYYKRFGGRRFHY